MVHSKTKSVVATTLVVLAIAVCSSPSNVTLRAATDVELASLLGAGCSGSQQDTNFCLSYSCIPQAELGISYKEVGTGKVKKWCGGTTGVCDCNQNNIPAVACTTQAVCFDLHCDTCGTPSDASLVQTQVNLFGAPCSSNAGCGGG
jgi:hypothetical protein